MKNVAVAGVGQTKFGELWDKSIRDLILDAGNETIKNSGVDKAAIGAVYIGCMSSGRFVGQEHLGALAADVLGLNVPSTRCEGACASGSLALRSAYHSILSGQHDVVLVLGVEKMNDLGINAVVSSLALAGDQEWEASVGLTFAGLYALMARAHMHKYGTTREQMAMVSVNNHENGVKNPLAQFRRPITIENVLKSNMIADPLRMLDCSPVTDGAAGLLLVSEKLANNIDKPVWIRGSGQGSDTLALHDRASFTEMLATKIAAKAAFDAAKLDIRDMNVIEVHDCFSINEIICLEDLGFCKKGEGGKFVEGGKIKIDGEIPTNTTGGLKSIGHPVGSTGVRQAVDIVRQIRGESCNQVNDAKNGLTLNVGGSGSTAVVNIFSGEKNAA